jgi:hypothetical protein
VWCLRIRVKPTGFRVTELGDGLLRVQGLGSNSGFRAWGLEFSVNGFRFKP